MKSPKNLLKALVLAALVANTASAIWDDISVESSVSYWELFKEFIMNNPRKSAGTALAVAAGAYGIHRYRKSPTDAEVVYQDWMKDGAFDEIITEEQLTDAYAALALAEDKFTAKQYNAVKAKLDARKVVLAPVLPLAADVAALQTQVSELATRPTANVVVNNTPTPVPTPTAAPAPAASSVVTPLSETELNAVYRRSTQSQQALANLRNDSGMVARLEVTSHKLATALLAKVKGQGAPAGRNCPSGNCPR